VKRIAVGELVVDQETVRRNFPEGPGEVDGVASYEVAAGKIVNARFKAGVPRLRPRTP